MPVKRFIIWTLFTFTFLESAEPTVKSPGMHVFVRRDDQLTAVEVSADDTARALYRKYGDAAHLTQPVQLTMSSGEDVPGTDVFLSDLGIGAEAQLDAHVGKAVEEMDEDECRTAGYHWVQIYDHGWDDCKCSETAPEAATEYPYYNHEEYC